jgi:hypothetical protein
MFFTREIDDPHLDNSATDDWMDKIIREKNNSRVTATPSRDQDLDPCAKLE